MKTDNKCLKCKGEMERGITVDKSHLYIPIVPEWATKIKWWGKTENSKEIITFRCNNCGYLESYAN